MSDRTTLLPEDIIAKILSLLPAKTLLRVACVCKKWYSLFKTPNFINLHVSTQHSLKPTSFICTPDLYSGDPTFDNELHFSKLHHPFHPGLVSLYGSCNGIVCISHHPSNNNVILLCNPITSSCFEVPSTRVPGTLKPYAVVFGFGYDILGDDYKVLRIVQGFKDGKIFTPEAKVFSCRENAWKFVKEGLSFYLLNVDDCYGVFVDSALHYVAVCMEMSSMDSCIVRFDLNTERFSLLGLPENYVMVSSDDNLELNLTNLGGCLCLMVNHHADSSKVSVLERADLWVMSEYGNKDSWFRLYSIETNAQMKPIVYSRDGRRILLEIDSLGFGWYDLESEIVERVTPHGMPEVFIKTSSFVGSLVSLENKVQSDSVLECKKQKTREMPASLPQEMIAAILSRLPVKSLLRFTLVCKSWHSLIKSHNFIKLHLNQSPISVICSPFLYCANLSFHPIQLYFSQLCHPFNPLLVSIFGSCNGVICISDYPSNKRIILYNPLTISGFELPFTEVPDLKPFSVVFGFGYDCWSDDYKVLRMVQGFKKGKIFAPEAKVFSHKKNSWECIEKGVSFYLSNAEDCHGILVDDALHYIAFTKEKRSMERCIVRFDLHTQRFSLMDLPNNDDIVWSNDRLELTLTNLDGCLCVMANYNADHSKSSRLERAELWVMNEYGNKESWFRLYSIETHIHVKPIVYSQDRRRLLFEIDSLGFGWYDFESATVYTFTPHGLPKFVKKTSVFVGSLVSLQNLHSVSGVQSEKHKARATVD